MQTAYPQGTINPAMQRGVFAAFLLLSACFLAAALLAALDKNLTFRA